MSALLVFVVEGRPVSWQRPHVLRNGAHKTDAKQREGKRALTCAARAAMPHPWDRSGVYAVTVHAYYPSRVFGDVDRIAGLPLDALEGIAYNTDRQVAELTVSRRVDKARPRVEVRVYALDPALETDAIMHGEAAE